jgi:hypothetical protein
MVAIMKVTDENSTVSQRYGSEDPNTYQNVTDLQHRFLVTVFVLLMDCTKEKKIPILADQCNNCKFYNTHFLCFSFEVVNGSCDTGGNF